MAALTSGLGTDLVFIIRRRRARSRRIAEDMKSAKTNFAHQVPGFLKLCLALSRKAHDYIGGKRGHVKLFLELGHQVQIIFPTIFSPHALKHSITAALQGDMKVLAYIGVGGDGRSKSRGKIGGLHRTNAEPV